MNCVIVGKYLKKKKKKINLNKLITIIFQNQKISRCFERSNKKHSTDCNRRIYQLINGIEAYNSKQLPFNDTTLYTDSFKEIEEVSSVNKQIK